MSLERATALAMVGQTLRMRCVAGIVIVVARRASGAERIGARVTFTWPYDRSTADDERHAQHLLSRAVADIDMPTASHGR